MGSPQHQAFAMFPRHLSNDAEEYMYPEPPQGAFTTGPMSMHLPTGAYSTFPRTQEGYATTLNMGTVSLYPDLHSYYAEDAEMPAGSSNLSTASLPSASSSQVGSPPSDPSHLAPIPEWSQGLGVSPGIVGQGDYFPSEYSFSGPMVGADEFPYDFTHPKAPGFVDPSLIHHEMAGPMPVPGYENAYQTSNGPYPTSPAISSPRNGSTSPFVQANNNYQYSPFPTPVDAQGRRPSIVSFHSTNYSPEQQYSGDESKEKQRCPHADCGKTFKDLKAHLLTHQTERPEKCPIQTCEYHVKGFSRKYDKNRHTLTHYKGTMVCGFCPGSGSAAEKSFNRADVFKRHLTAVHGVEQTPPNARKKMAGSVGGAKKLTGNYAPDATGKCSTCAATFANAQDFYEHLDDCVLRIVQQEDPAEAINAKRLAEVENDKEVHNTLEKNRLSVATQAASTSDDDMEDEDMADEDAEGEEDSEGGRDSRLSGTKRKGNPPNGVQKSRGMTHSRGGVPLQAKKGGRKSRRDYPSSWGFDKGQMNLKKRVLTVFDGQRRLAKDDMMLSTDYEVRTKLSDGKSYITDLDILSIRRADALHDATEEEKGPWISDDPTDADRQTMLDQTS